MTRYHVQAGGWVAGLQSRQKWDKTSMNIDEFTIWRIRTLCEELRFRISLLESLIGREQTCWIGVSDVQIGLDLKDS